MLEPTITLDEAKAIVATKTAPRVTEDSIKAKIATVEYAMGNTLNYIVTEPEE